MNHEDLADTLEVERVQVEWAFTVFGIIQSLYDLSLDERRQVLNGLCGMPPDPDFQVDWDKEYIELPDVSNDIEILRWLVLGLDDSSSIRITDLLEEIRSIQLLEIPEPDDLDEALIEPPRLSLPQPIGFLILRLRNLEHEHWNYYTFNQEQPWTIKDLTRESDVLTQILTTCQVSKSIPVALLSFEQDSPPASDVHTDIVSTTHSIITSQQHGLSEQFHQSIQVDVSGEFQAQVTDATTRFKCAWQRTGQWTYSLQMLQGPEYPMVWNLQSLITQKASGSGGSNGHAYIRSSVFTQILGDQTLLGGTSSLNEPQAFPEQMEQRADSQHCIWQLPYSALDFKDHATHLNIDAKPMFNTAISIDQDSHHLDYIQGSGQCLQEQYFVEMMLQAIQTDRSRRTQVHLQSTTSITITGDLTWCGHQITLCPTSESDSWTWIHEANRRTI